MELEKRLSGSIKLEEELKFEKIRLQNDVHAFTKKMAEMQNEIEKVQKEKEKLMVSKIELEKELMRYNEENQTLLSQVCLVHINLINPNSLFLVDFIFRLHRSIKLRKKRSN